jgi:outer membrane protein assembly factor BamB
VKRLYVTFCFLWVVFISVSCHTPKETRIINSADIGIDLPSTYIIQSDSPLIYNKENHRTHKLISDPFMQLDRSGMTNRYIVSSDDDGLVYAMLRSSLFYEIYRIDSITLKSSVDCKVSKGLSPSSFLGLNNILKFSMTTGFRSSSRQQADTYVFFTRKDEQIIIRSNGIFSLKRGKSGYEKCLCEDSIKGGNFAFNGESVYYLDSHNTLYEFDINKQTKTAIKEKISYFYINTEEILFSLNEQNGSLYKMSLEGEAVEKIASIPFDLLICVQNYIIYVDSKDKHVYRISKEGTDKVKIIDKSVNRLGVMNNPDRLIYQKTNGEIILSDFDGNTLGKVG